MTTRKQNIDIELWLKERNLEKLINEFKQRNISIEELCQFEENDLKEFGIGFGLDTFDSARFAKFIVKQKIANDINNDNMDNLVSRAVVITSDEEKLLQKLEERKNDILSLISRGDSESSTMKEINAKNIEIIECKFADLIKKIELRKEEILKEIILTQKDKELIISKNVISLKEYLKNIENIINDYNKWLIENKMNRNERKDKLSKIVEKECDKLLPQIADVQVIYNNRLILPFLGEICKIVNIGLFYPEINNFMLCNIGPKSITIKWNAKLSKEHLIYVEMDNLKMNHIMMSLQCKRIKIEEIKDADNDNDDDDDEEIKEDEEIDDIDINMIHCIDFELDEEEYEYKFNDLRPNSVYLVTFKCISILKDSLISQHHQLDLDKFKMIKKEFKTLKKFKQFIFRSNLERINILNDGKTVQYVNNNDGRICVCILGEYINLDIVDRKFKLKFNIDNKTDHIGFGFVANNFNTFEHDEWGFGGKCTFFYSDRDFRGSIEFQNKNTKRLTINNGNIIYMEIDCINGIGKIWLDGDENNFVETTLPKQFAIAVSLGGRIGSSVTFINSQEMS